MMALEAPQDGDLKTSPVAEIKGDTGCRLELAVVGAHLAGLELNHQLLSLGASFSKPARTAREYRLYALPRTQTPKPGLVRDPGYSGSGIEIEIWNLSPAAFGTFVAAIPSPLGIGKILLEDRTMVSGFLCEPHGLAGATEITAYGGWRAYHATLLQEV